MTRRWMAILRYSQEYPGYKIEPGMEVIVNYDTTDKQSSN